MSDHGGHPLAPHPGSGHERLGGAADTARLEAFSDGVFAIAITLLVLEIRVPSGAELGAGGLWGAIGTRWPSFVAYIISFITIGIMWANHHAMFQYIRHTDRRFMLINVLFLMCISFLPFPTAVLAEFLPEPAHRQVATLFYSGTLVVIAIMYNAVWRYGTWRGRLLAHDADLEAVGTITRRYTLGPVMYGLSAALALINAWASLAVHGVLAVYYAFSERTPVVRRRRRDG